MGHKGKKSYLHKLMDMTADHLIKRCAGNLLHLPEGKEFVNTIYDRLCIDQMLDPTFSFPLPPTFSRLRGRATSSIETPGEAS